jgi:hypothetical protein
MFVYFMIETSIKTYPPISDNDISVIHMNFFEIYHNFMFTCLFFFYGSFGSTDISSQQILSWMMALTFVVWPWNAKFEL